MPDAPAPWCPACNGVGTVGDSVFRRRCGPCWGTGRVLDVSDKTDLLRASIDQLEDSIASLKAQWAEYERTRGE